MSALKYCFECGHEFTSGADKVKHVSTHMPYVDYIVKNFYNNIHPTCKCGCGIKLSFKANLNPPFFSEYTKNHFPRKSHTEKTKKLIKENSIKAVKEKYGVNNVMELPEFIDKIAKTKEKKYGDPHYNNTKKSVEKFLKTFFKKIKSGERLPTGIIPLFTEEHYKGVHIEHKFKCIDCDLVFEARLAGKYPKCPNCVPNIKTSIGENELFSFIKNLVPDELILRNNRSLHKGEYELDLYIPDRKLAIEYHGLYWHSEHLGEKTKKYHYDKLKKTEALGVQLIQIFEDEWINSQEIVKTRISHILGKSPRKIYARKCEIVSLSTEDKNEFLEKNHIQGKDHCKIAIGLKYENEIIAVMTFSGLRRALGHKNKSENIYELSRFCSKFSVIGGASKLFSHFLNIYKPLSVISYADRRWTTILYDTVYDKLGFFRIGETGPNYWYMKNYSKRIHRFSFTKKKIITKMGGDSELTEFENMVSLNYDRIWDCGSFKFVYTPLV